MSPDLLDGFARYAVYWAPEGALARLGAAWLGHDPAGAPVPPPPDLPGLPRPRAALAGRAARYGLHATLKAPFRLAAGATAADLDAGLAALAAAQAPATGPGLAVAALDGFVALCPAGPAPAVDALAGTCVAALDRFRAPLTEAELAERRRGGLSPAEDAHLARWGYPYVLDAFRFHVTLTASLPPAEAEAARAALAAHLAPALAPAFTLDALCLFGDPGGGAPFRLLRRHRLTGGAAA